MEVALNHIYKRFISEWILEDFSYHFESGKIYGIKGRNGRGKSTLLGIISSALQASKGTISYKIEGNNIQQSTVYQLISSYSAGDDLIDEFTAIELFKHRSRFKKMNIKSAQFFKLLELKGHENKTINTYSSGMKQRFALGLSLYTDARLLLFDEPSSYLDEEKKNWFNNTLKSREKEDDIIIIASNDPFDFQLCDEIIELS